MKSFRNALAALVLAFVFSTSAFASEGIIHTEKTSPPPPVQAEGIIHTETTPPAPETDVVTEIALSVLQNLLTLL